MKRAADGPGWRGGRQVVVAFEEISLGFATRGALGAAPLLLLPSGREVAIRSTQADALGLIDAGRDGVAAAASP